MITVRTVYQLLQFFANWLSQPTLIEVAESLEIKQS
jgi:hypothetical protein